MLQCADGANCEPFKRLIDRGDRLEDRCHVRMFGHPARDRYARLPKGYTPFVYRSQCLRHDPPEDNLSAEQQLQALMEEVKCNGYSDDLVTADGNSLLTVVDRKLAHRKSKEMAARNVLVGGKAMTRAEMLAAVMYTGCDCNYAMSAAERRDDFKTWQWFSYLLYRALYRMWWAGDEKPMSFSGVPEVRVEASVGERIFLATHTSASEDFAVAQRFAKGSGVILEFVGGKEGIVGDVSWISKFPSEREWLRSGDDYVAFTVKEIFQEAGGRRQQRVILEYEEFHPSKEEAMASLQGDISQRRYNCNLL